MSLQVTNKAELLSKLDSLRQQAKKKYVDFGGKLLIYSVNTLNSLARHLIVLQGKDPHAVPEEKIAWKDPSVIAAVHRTVSETRPSFNFGSSSNWSIKYLKNPVEYHPILRCRAELDEKGILNVSNEFKYNAEVFKTALDTTIDATEKLTPKDASVILDAMDGILGTSTPSPNESLDIVNVVSGSRSVSKKKVSVKKVAPKKKAVKVKRVKNGVFRRAED